MTKTIHGKDRKKGPTPLSNIHYVFAIGMMYVFYLLSWPVWLFHTKLRQGRKQRWANASLPKSPTQRPIVWLHGASAGDILALVPTARCLQQAGISCIVSSITTHGQLIAQKYAHVFSASFYLPYDMPNTIHRVLQHFQPQAIVLEYTELWPVLIHQAQRHQIPLILHNGRLAPQKLPYYRLLFMLCGHLLRAFSLLCMRDPSEAQNAKRLGLPESTIHVTGNTKYDRDYPQEEPKQQHLRRQHCGIQHNSIVWMVGSSHHNEEQQLLPVYLKLKQSFPQLKWMIAPRYPQRAVALQRWLKTCNISSHLYSSTRAGSAYDVTIIDTMGELHHFYAISTLVFVGGSLVPRGGQNILEPLYHGKATVFGPYMQNFQTIAEELIPTTGAVQVHTPDALYAQLDAWLKNPQQCQQAGRKAQDYLLHYKSSAAQKNAEWIVQTLRPLPNLSPRPQR
jgi:3-deoxy-D-manno-octulosonic-acid transferase